MDLEIGQSTFVVVAIGAVVIFLFNFGKVKPPARLIAKALLASLIAYYLGGLLTSLAQSYIALNPLIAPSLLCAGAVFGVPALANYLDRLAEQDDGHSE